MLSQQQAARLQELQAWKAKRVKQTAQVDSIFAEDLKPRAGPDPTRGMNTPSKLAAGFGQGLTNVGRHAGNLVGAVSDDELASAKASDEALLNTGAGMAGSLLGETAALAPLGAIGGVAKGAQAARIARGAAQGGKVAKAIGAAGLVGEGAATGALMADPGNKDIGALAGSAISGGLGGLGKVMGRVGGGIVKKSPEAQALMKETGQEFMPIGMAAADDGASGMAKWAYNNLLPALPLTTGTLKGQVDDATRALRSHAIKQGTPDGAVPNLAPQGATQDFVSTVAKTFDEGYKRVFTDVKGKEMSFLAKELPPVSKEASDIVRKKFGDLTRLTGTDLMEAKKLLQDEAAKHINVAGRQVSKDMLAAADAIDELVKVRLMKGVKGPSPKNMAKLEEYGTLNSKWMEFKQLEEAAQGAVGGEFSMGSLQKIVQREGKKAGTPSALQKYTDRAAGVHQDISEPGLWSKLAAMATAAATGGGAMLAAPVAATKPMQNLLMGDNFMQKGTKELLKKNPIIGATAGALRRSASGQVE